MVLLSNETFRFDSFLRSSNHRSFDSLILNAKYYFVSKGQDFLNGHLIFYFVCRVGTQ